MDENKKMPAGGKRAKKKKKRGWIVVLIVLLCLVLGAAGGYIALCNWAADRVLPNTTAQGLQLEGLTRAQAEVYLRQLTDPYDAVKVDIICEDTLTVFEAEKADVAYNVNAVLDAVTLNEPFLYRGITWLQAMYGEPFSIEMPMMFAEPVYIDGVISELNSLLTNPVVQHSITVEDGVAKVTRGRAGQAIHTEGLEEILLEKVLTGDDSPLVLKATITQPREPNFQTMYDTIYTEAVNAALDPETMTIIPHKMGVVVNLDDVDQKFALLAPGESYEPELTLIEPEVTTEFLTENLFAHKLGNAYSYITGSSARVSNVTLAASLCQDSILLPGEVFSYWEHIAPCSEEQGFLDAPTYYMGQTVPGVGGGICQMSSTLYTACLASNLEIVQRNPHTYPPSYLPSGSDAMVNGGSSDYQFRNNTPYPLQIRAKVDGRNLTVELWGTKTDDTYVVMEHYQLSTNPYKTFYKFSDSQPIGTSKVQTDPYTGNTTVSYRCIYAGDGTLISREKEGVSIYAKRDEVIIINPADSYKYNMDPITGEKLPDPEPTPAPIIPGPTPTPTPTPTPVVTPTPEVTATPEVTPTPAVSVTPEAPAPEVSQPEVSQPEVSPTPAAEAEQ